MTRDPFTGQQLFRGYKVFPPGKCDLNIGTDCEIYFIAPRGIPQSITVAGAKERLPTLLGKLDIASKGAPQEIEVYYRFLAGSPEEAQKIRASSGLLHDPEKEQTAEIDAEIAAYRKEKRG